MNIKINILFSLGIVLGWMSPALSTGKPKPAILDRNKMEKPKLAILDRIEKLEKQVSELNDYRPCLTRICPKQA